MIIYHQNNIAAFAGNHIFYFQFQHLLHSRISITAGAAPSGGLFMKQANLDGLNIGGPFFANPVG